MIPGHDKHPTRVQVEVDGFTWRVYGGKAGLHWHCHLVELVGPLPLDGPVTQPLRDNRPPGIQGRRTAVKEPPRFCPGRPTR